MPDSALSHFSGLDRLAVRQHRIHAEGGVAGAHKVSLLAGRDSDALSVVRLAIHGASGW